MIYITFSMLVQFANRLTIPSFVLGILEALNLLRALCISATLACRVPSWSSVIASLKKFYNYFMIHTSSSWIKGKINTVKSINMPPIVGNYLQTKSIQTTGVGSLSILCLIITSIGLDEEHFIESYDNKAAIPLLSYHVFSYPVSHL